MRELLAQSATRCAESAVTFWELSLKYALGKLELSGVAPSEFPHGAGQMHLAVLPLDGATAATVHQLPAAGHRDPFDRLIAWQAIHADLTLISKDAAGLRRFW